MKVKKTVSRKFSERNMISKTFIRYTIVTNLYNKNKKKEEEQTFSIFERTKKTNRALIQTICKKLDPEMVLLDAKVKTAAEVRYLISVDDFIANAVEAQ